MFKKIPLGASALALVSTPIVASAQPVYHAARYEGRGWRGHDNSGAAVAAGLFGLIVGAAIASSSHPDYDRGYGYGYGYGGYGDYQPYPTRCDWETRAYPGPYGTVSYQQVQVCR